MTTQEEVARILLNIKAVSLNAKKPYRYSSGILSPVYTDCRILMGYPKERKRIRDLYVKAIKESKKSFNLISATATSAIPHGAWVAEKLNLPMIYVRGSAKDHGKGRLVEGVAKKGDKAVIIEDLISTGDSSINTLKETRKAGAKADLVITIITYGMKKATDNFKKNKAKLIAMTSFSDVVSVALKMGQISEKEKDLIIDWTKDPGSWGKRNGFE